MVNQQQVEIRPVEFKKRLQSPGQKRLLLLDVREPEEYRDWRIDGSFNIPINNLFSPKSLKRLPRKSEIVTICAHGIRSAKAASSLRQLGFDAVHLKEGLVGWSRVYDVAPLSTAKDGLRVLQIRRLGKGCTSYMLCYKGEAAVVDPSVHIDEFISLANEKNVCIRHVADTHLHADHVSGARALSRKTGAMLHFNPLEQYRRDGFAPLKEGEDIGLGRLTIKVIHTPGHTMGSTSFLVANRFLLTGDALFVEALARPDLHEKAEEFARDLYHTYRVVYSRISGNAIVLPGHFSTAVPIRFGEPFGSTLGELQVKLPKMEAEETEFMDYVLGNIPPKPPSYAKILEINRHGYSYSLDEVDELEEGPNRCALRA